VIMNQALKWFLFALLVCILTMLLLIAYIAWVNNGSRQLPSMILFLVSLITGIFILPLIVYQIDRTDHRKLKKNEPSYIAAPAPKQLIETDDGETLEVVEPDQTYRQTNKEASNDMG